MGKFATIYDISSLDVACEKVDSKSMTIPDMSFSVRDILERYTSGQQLLIQKNGSFEDEPSFDMLNPMETSDDLLTTREDMLIELDTSREKLQKAQKNSLPGHQFDHGASNDDEGGRR